MRRTHIKQYIRSDPSYTEAGSDYTSYLKKDLLKSHFHFIFSSFVHKLRNNCRNGHDRRCKNNRNDTCRIYF